MLEAYSQNKAYRVCGLGHSAQFTLFDLISDFSGDTPTAAGYHISEQLAKLNDIYAKQSELKSGLYLNEKEKIKYKRKQKPWIVWAKLLITLIA